MSTRPDNPFVFDTWQERLAFDLSNALVERADVMDAWTAARRLHLAIMREPWASYVADGSKLLESRWGRVRCAPHDAIDAGDVIAWKRTGGPVYGVSCVTKAVTHYLHSEDAVRGYVRSLHRPIRIPDDPTPYLDKRLLTLIWLGPFVATPTPIEVKQPGRAGWIVVHERSALLDRKAVPSE